MNSQGIIFALDVAGSISGTVLDDQGDPVPQAQVYIFRKRVFSGKWQTLLGGTASTDSSGAFYMGHLGPGTYLIAVQARPWYAQNFFAPQQQQDQPFYGPGMQAEASPASELDVAYPVTYYGDVLDSASASPITINEGGSATVQITLQPVAAVHVDLVEDDRQPNKRIAPQIFAAGPGGFLLPINTQTFNTGNHQEITGIAPGHYVVTVQSFNQNRMEPAGTKILELTGNSTLDLRDAPKTSVSGQVSFEGNQRPSGNAMIQLTGQEQVFTNQNLEFPITSDGSLEMKNAEVIPGHYRVQILNAPGFYVKSLSVKGGKVSGNEIDVTEGAAVNISIAAAKGLTRVDGEATKDGVPIAGAMVLLVPQDLSRGGQFRRDQSDSDGTFSLMDVEPGRYTLVAIDNGRDLEYQNPAVINEYLSQGEPLEVPLRDHSAVKVSVQGRR